MGKFRIMFNQSCEFAEVSFVDLASAINFGSRDPRGRHFVVVYTIAGESRVVHKSREVVSA